MHALRAFLAQTFVGGEATIARPTTGMFTLARRRPGALIALPLVSFFALPVIALLISVFVPSEALATALLAGVALPVFAGMLFALAAFVVDAARRPELDPTARAVWIVGLLLLGPVGQLVYWFAVMRQSA